MSNLFSPILLKNGPDPVIPKPGEIYQSKVHYRFITITNVIDNHICFYFMDEPDNEKVEERSFQNFNMIYQKIDNKNWSP